MDRGLGVREGGHDALMLRQSDLRRQAYDLTQRLTYFVISAELVFCGYMLLNAHTLGEILLADYLFVASGVAAISGIVWRLLYNENFHRSAHGMASMGKLGCWLELKTYYLFVSLSIVTFVVAIYVGFEYLHSLPHHY